MNGYFPEFCLKEKKKDTIMSWTHTEDFFDV